MSIKTKSNIRRSSRDDDSAPPRPWLAILAVTSILVSCTVIIWVFSLPFRTSVSVKAQPVRFSDTDSGSTFGFDAKVKANEVRQRAFRDHQQFVRDFQRDRAKKLAARQSDDQAAEDYRQRKLDSMLAEIRRLDRMIAETDEPEGSVFWVNRQYLRELSEDMVSVAD